jgi:hypothetical protein
MLHVAWFMFLTNASAQVGIDSAEAEEEEGEY